MRHTSIKLMFFLGVLTFYSLIQAQEKPNFVFIYIDDLGWSDVGYNEREYYSSPLYRTPNIDKLATDGISFTNAYANAGNCAPSRAALLSGQYGPRTGVYTVDNSSRPPYNKQRLIPIQNTKHLSGDKVTFAEALKDNGYVTAHMGKWHLGEGNVTGPISQGFDINIGGFATGSPPGGYFCPWNSKAVGLESCSAGDYLTDRLNEEAEVFIKNNQDTSFFLNLSHYAVHTPIQAQNDLISYFDSIPGGQGHSNKTYAAMIKSVDDGLGRIISLLDSLNISNNTYVIFMSDNGGPLNHTDNNPLRAGKGGLYEGGIRVPLIFKRPGVIQKGSVSNVPVIGTDLYPTFLAAANISPPVNYKLDGESLLPLLKNEDNLIRTSLFWHYPVYLNPSTGCDCLGGGKSGFRTTPVGAIRKGNFKLLEYFEYGQLELYNIKEDIGETNNLALENSSKVKELYEEMVNWRNSIGAPVPDELNPDFEITNSEPVRGDYVTYEDVLNVSVNKFKNIENGINISRIGANMIRLELSGWVDVVQINILNSSGNTVHSQHFSTSRYTNNLNNRIRFESKDLIPGVYIFQILGLKKMVNKRIVVL